MAVTQKQAKEVQIIARVQFKNNPKAVIYKVRSSNGKAEYTTTIYDGKAASCTCPATKPCYHMVQLEVRERARQPQITEVSEKGSLHSSKAFSLMR